MKAKLLTYMHMGVIMTVCLLLLCVGVFTSSLFVCFSSLICFLIDLTRSATKSSIQLLTSTGTIGAMRPTSSSNSMIVLILDYKEKRNIHRHGGSKQEVS